MNRVRNVFSATWVVACIGAGMLGGAISVHAAEQAVVNKEVAKHITEAKKQAGKKQWDAALASLRKADQAPEKTPYAEYKIDEFRAYVLTQQRKYGEAAGIFEKLADAEQASGKQRAAHMKTAAQLYMQAKQYPKAAQAAQQARKSDPGDATLLQIEGQSRYLTGDYKGAAGVMQQLVAATEKRGGTPEESWLQILLNSYYKLNDRQRIADTWESLVRYHPKPDYWRNVLASRAAKSQPKPIELGYRRLMFDLGLLKDPRDYEDLAMSAIDSGVPAQAVRVLEAGFDKQMFTGANESRFSRMLEYAKHETAKSDASFAELQQQAQSAGAGQASVALGRAYLAREQYGEAIAALQTGIEKGRLENPDQARVELAIAYIKDEKPEQAKKTLAAVKRDSEWRDLADLWSLRASNIEGG